MKRFLEDIMFPGLESPKYTIGKIRPWSGPDKHKIHSIAKHKPESLHHVRSEVIITPYKKAGKRRK